MIRIKFCGLTRWQDIECANRLRPDCIGFVFWKKSRRYVDEEAAGRLRDALDKSITSVGVFVDEEPERVAHLINEGIIDAAQLHGGEDDEYIAKLRNLIMPGKVIIKAFRITSDEDIKIAQSSSADMILLDAGMGEGASFDWTMIRDMQRPYYLAGGLDCQNVAKAVEMLSPYGVDVSSGIETDGIKDPGKMKEFAGIVRSFEVQ